MERVLKNLDKEIAKYKKAVEKAKTDTNSVNNFPADDADRLFHQIARLTGGLDVYKRQPTFWIKMI